MLMLLALTPFLALAAPGSDKVAVIGSPWTDERGMIAIIARANGLTVESGGHANVMIARSPDADFAQRLYHAGAWLVLSSGLVSGCRSPTSQEQS
jgi:hypothetical protein